LSKYRLPNGLEVELNDQTGETTVLGGGGRTIAPGARLTPGGDMLGAAPKPEQNVSASLGPGSSAPETEAPPVTQLVPKPVVSLDKPRPGNEPLEHDPIAQAIVSTALTEPLAAVAGPVAAALGRGARARVAARLPTQLTEGAVTPAAKSVIAARETIGNIAHADPELAKVLSGGASAAEKKAAVVQRLADLSHVDAHAEALESIKDLLDEQIEEKAAQRGGKLVKAVKAIAHPGDTAVKVAEHIGTAVPNAIDQKLALLAGESGPRGVAALKGIVASPTLQSVAEAVRAGIKPQVALQVAKTAAGGSQ